MPQGGLGGIGSSTILGECNGALSGSVFGRDAAIVGASGVGRPGEPTESAVFGEDLAGIRSSAICATRARNGLGWAPNVGAAPGCAAERFVGSTRGAVVWGGGPRGAASSTKVGGGAGAVDSTGGFLAGAASTGVRLADSTSGRTSESMVSPVGTAGSSSAATVVSTATEECPLVKPKSRYCC